MYVAVATRRMGIFCVTTMSQFEVALSRNRWTRPASFVTPATTTAAPTTSCLRLVYSGWLLHACVYGYHSISTMSTSTAVAAAAAASTTTTTSDPMVCSCQEWSSLASVRHVLVSHQTNKNSNNNSNNNNNNNSSSSSSSSHQDGNPTKKRPHRDRFSSLLEWITGAVNDAAWREQRPLSCGAAVATAAAAASTTACTVSSPYSCRHRGEVSLVILNAIRDACRPFLGEETEHVGGRARGGGRGSAGAGAGGAGGDHFKYSYYMNPDHCTKDATTRPEQQQQPSLSLSSSSSLSYYERAFPPLHTTTTATATLPVTRSGLAGRKHGRGGGRFGAREDGSSSGGAGGGATAAAAASGAGEMAVSHSSDDASVHATTPQKNKRRIRPAPVVLATTSTTTTTTTTNAAGGTVWGGASPGNLVHVPSSNEPLLPDTDAMDPTVIAWLTQPLAGGRFGAGGGWNQPAARPTTVPAADPTSLPPQPLKPQESWDEVLLLPKLNNLVQLYGALVKSCLVPSSLLELHLLIRLVTIKIESTNVSSLAKADKSEFTNILSSPIRCKAFGYLALQKLSFLLQGLPLSLQKDFVQCPLFQREIPDLVRQVEEMLAHRTAAVSAPMGDFMERHRTALLTVPFDLARDSRHNFRGLDAQALFKNREESRDAFLYQLRSFVNIRGKVLAQAEVDRTIRTIKRSSHELATRILHSNIPWFCDFFCDLLMQVGLVPLEETDTDLLKLADQDKLQQLHKRFSDKAPQNANKSTQKIAASSNRLKSASPPEEAQHLFPGRQEFFFMFLLSADSYLLATHLKSKLAQTLQTVTLDVGTQNLENRILESKMIARFLGLLIYSPSWFSPLLPVDASISTSSDGLTHLLALDMSIVDIVNEAISSGNLVVAVPWIVDLLRMSVWSLAQADSARFQQVVGHLRSIQLQLSSNMTRGSSAKETAVLIRTSLESLFDEVVGITNAGSFQTYPLEMKGVPPDSMDNLELSFGSAFMSATSPYVEELSALIATLSQGLSSLRSPGISRKLRPSVVASTDDLEAQLNFTDMVTSKLGSIFEHANASKPLDALRLRLQDTFFHQHNGLKEMCDFAGKSVLASSLSKLVPHCLQPFLKERFSESSGQILEEAAKSACRDFLRSLLTANIRQAVSAMVPNELKEKVVETAVSITVVNALSLSEQTINDIVLLEIKTFEANRDKEKRSLRFEPVVQAGDQAEQEAPKSWMALATDAIDDLILQLKGEEFASCFVAIVAVLDSLEQLTKHNDAQIPPDNELRSFYQSMLSLDFYSPRIINWCMLPVTGNEKQRWEILSAYLQMACRLKKWSSHGPRGVIDFVSQEESLRALIKLGLAVKFPPPMLAKLLVDLFSVKFINAQLLETCLARAIEHNLDGSIELGVNVLANVDHRQPPVALRSLRFMVGNM